MCPGPACGGETGLWAAIGTPEDCGGLFWGVIGDVGWGDIKAADILRSYKTINKKMLFYHIVNY